MGRSTWLVRLKAGGPPVSIAQDASALCPQCSSASKHAKLRVSFVVRSFYLSSFFPFFGNQFFLSSFLLFIFVKKFIHPRPNHSSCNIAVHRQVQWGQCWHQICIHCISSHFEPMDLLPVHPKHQNGTPFPTHHILPSKQALWALETLRFAEQRPCQDLLCSNLLSTCEGRHLTDACPLALFRLSMDESVTWWRGYSGYIEPKERNRIFSQRGCQRTLLTADLSPSWFTDPHLRVSELKKTYWSSKMQEAFVYVGARTGVHKC